MTLCLLADSLTPPSDLLAHPHGAYHALLLFVYGALLIVGGSIGYIKAKSIPSLVAGTISGIIAIVLGFFTAHTADVYAALALSVFLILVLGRRYLATKATPALVTVLLSGIVAAAQVYSLIRHH